MILSKLFDGIFLSAEEEDRGCAGCAHKQQRCPQSHTGIIAGFGDIGVDRSNGRPERGYGNIGFDGDLVACLVFLGADLPTLEDFAGRSGETVGAELMLIRPIYIPFYYLLFQNEPPALFLAVPEDPEDSFFARSVRVTLR